MPEGMNVEVAHKLSVHERADRAKHRWQEVLEVLEVLVLAVAASTLGGQELVADSSMFNPSSSPGAPTTRSCRRCSLAGSPPSTAAPSRPG